jgi:hypothetical protein
LIDYGGLASSMVVTSPLGLTIDGTYTQISDSYWAWQPSAELLPGTYLIETTNGPPLHQRNGILSAQFTVVEPIDLARPVLASEPSLSLVAQGVDQACCQQWTDFGVLQGQCTALTEVTYAALSTGLTTSTPAMALRQYLFRVDPAGLGPSLYLPFDGARQLLFEVADDEYCFEIEAIAIFDSTLHPYAELESCAPHGDLGEVGMMPVEPSSSFFDRSQCTEPPLGFEDEWCEENADCEGATNMPQCVLFDHLCNGGVRPQWMPFVAGAGGFGGASGMAGVGGADRPAGSGGFSGIGGSGGTIFPGGPGGASGMSAAKDDSGPIRDGTFCAIAAPGAASRSSRAWFALGVALALFGVRRRAR